MDTPQHTYGQRATAAITILLAAWFAGMALSWVPRIDENPLVMAIVVFLGPGLVAFQQYRSTFHLNLSAARFCMVLTCCSAVFFTLLFLIMMYFVAFQFVSRLELPPITTLILTLVFLAVLINIARSNLHWWLELKQWYEESGGPFQTHRFTLREMFLLTLVVGIALGLARYYSTR